MPDPVPNGQASASPTPDAGMTEGDLSTAFTDAVPTSSDPAPAVDPVPSDPAPASDTPAPAPQPVATDPAAPQPAVEPQPAPAGLDTFLSQAAGLGIDTNGVTSQEELLQRMIGHTEQVVPYVKFAKSTLPYADQIREIVSQPSQDPKSDPAPQPTPQEPSDEWSLEKHFEQAWGGPLWKPEYQTMIDRGLVVRDPETGGYAAAPGQEFLVGNTINDINAAAAHSADFWGDLTRSNPYQKLYSKFEEPINRLVERRVQEVLAAQSSATAAQNAVQAFEQQHASELYVTDETTGKVMWSPKGAEFEKHVRYLQEKGMTDQASIVEIAGKLAGLGATPNDSASSAPAAQTTPAASPAKPDQTVGEQVAQSFIQRAVEVGGHAPSAVEPDPVPVSTDVTETELSNMFVNAVGAQ